MTLLGMHVYKKVHDYNAHSSYSTPAISRNFEKMGVPKPVIGSQPTPTVNPSVPHPGLCPVVILLAHGEVSS